MEQLERLGYDPQGALYKAVGNLVPGFNSTGGFEKRTRLYEDRSDYLALANGISESQPLITRRTNLFDMIDVPVAVNYLAVARWCQEGDDVWANMTIYRDTLGDQMWRVIPFDMNVSWGQLYCGDTPSVYQNIIATNDLYKGHPLYGGSAVPVAGGGSGFNRMYDVIISVPEAREMLLRRMRTLMDNFIQPPDTHPLAYKVEQQMLSFSNAVYPESILDRLKWGWESTTLGQANGPYCFGANQWLTNHLPEIMTKFVIPRRQHWYVAHCITNTAKAIGVATNLNAGIPTTQPSNAVISMVGLDYSPASGNQNEEYICLTNSNPYAVDMSGWQLGGAVDFTFKGGTVLGSNRVLYVSPNIAAFRNRAVAPHGGMGLLVVGPYHGQLSARGEPITIRDDHGRLVYTNSYPGNPSLAQQFLRITEIMYNPTPLVGSTNDPQDFEYIELKNISPTTPIDLTGVRFVNGVFFDFTGSAVTTLAPGERVLVVRNLAAFTARYGAGHVAGQYTGNLDNKGERVQLLDSVNEEILDFSYNNSWYPATDGLGFSLVIQDENAADLDLWGHKEGWRSSGQVDGAPGAADPPGPSFPSIVVNEVLAHTDLPAVDVIELFNPTTDPANLGGWYLSDNFDVPKKYRITNGCVIAAGGYVTFDANLFNNAATALVPFSLSSKGDTVWLFSGDGTGALTGYVFGEDFGASANGVSLGRYTNSVGTVNFVAQSSKTLGGPNAGPLVGPVVISEIMYHPPDLPGAVDDSQNEYVELQNITGSPVALYDPGAPSHTWRLRGGVDYEFPSGLTLPAGGTLLVISFDTNEVR
ncbi:MAG TPA: lamin tail domain-containing protein, partial [Candidatus Saccharimonadales bacterium]|nr:lamin tail domain-containing protein [Candidatus Saccharimonadales bacterium]